jgi:tRNA-splicing ligase RtcB
MIGVYKTENEYGKGTVKSWASIIDDATQRQAERISRVPVIEGYLALMPDAHYGFGPPVGSALMTKTAVMPYAVGVDIGCGMIAVETDIDRDAFRGVEGDVLGNIRELIPSGVGPATSRRSSRRGVHRRQRVCGRIDGLKLSHSGGDLKQKALIQFGTLGAGNHFVEVCEDSRAHVWLLLHSGSRGIGNLLATARQPREELLRRQRHRPRGPRLRLPPGRDGGSRRLPRGHALGAALRVRPA